MAEPRTYVEILKNGYVPGRDFSVSFGDSNIDRCLLIAPHGGGIEPGTSEIMKAVADLGGWAWFDFAGYLRKGNKESLHITSTSFDEPILSGLLRQTGFVLAFHGSSEANEPIVYVGGKWNGGRRMIVEGMNAAVGDHGIRAVDAIENAAGHLQGLDDSNVTNRGKRAEGVQLEFSRGARNLLFPPDASREARGRRNAQLRSLAASINAATKQLCALPAAGRAGN